MPIRGDGVGGAVHEIAEHGRALARLEAELATLELRRKVASLGAGAALAAAGGVVAFLAFGFLLAALAAALATFMPAWLAILLVGFALVAAAIVLGAIGISLLRRGVPPVPQEALAEAKLTGMAIKRNGSA